MNPLYIRAFQSFSGAHENEFKCSDYSDELIVLWKHKTYRVTSFNDLINNYKDYFSGPSYDDIYVQTPAPLWHMMLNEYIDMPASKLISKLYREWVAYWYSQKEKIKGGKERYNELKEESWIELQALFHAINAGPTDAINSADIISDSTFVPLLALVIKSSYENEEEFYVDCINLLTEYGDDFITDGDTFEAVTIDVDGSELDFFIYNPMYDYKDAVES